MGGLACISHQEIWLDAILATMLLRGTAIKKAPRLLTGGLHYYGLSLLFYDFLSSSSTTSKSASTASSSSPPAPDASDPSPGACSPLGAAPPACCF